MPVRFGKIGADRHTSRAVSDPVNGKDGHGQRLEVLQEILGLSHVPSTGF
jgi:hypothetical protein